MGNVPTDKSTALPSMGSATNQNMTEAETLARTFYPSKLRKEKNKPDLPTKLECVSAQILVSQHTQRTIEQCILSTTMKNYLRLRDIVTQCIPSTSPDPKTIKSKTLSQFPPLTLDQISLLARNFRRFYEENDFDKQYVDLNAFVPRGELLGLYHFSRLFSTDLRRTVQTVVVHNLVMGFPPLVRHIFGLKMYFQGRNEEAGVLDAPVASSLISVRALVVHNLEYIIVRSMLRTVKNEDLSMEGYQRMYGTDVDKEKKGPSEPLFTIRTPTAVIAPSLLYFEDFMMNFLQSLFVLPHSSFAEALATAEALSLAFTHAMERYLLYLRDPLKDNFSVWGKVMQARSLPLSAGGQSLSKDERRELEMERIMKRGKIHNDTEGMNKEHRLTPIEEGLLFPTAKSRKTAESSGDPYTWDLDRILQDPSYLLKMSQSLIIRLNTLVHAARVTILFYRHLTRILNRHHFRGVAVEQRVNLRAGLELMRGFDRSLSFFLHVGSMCVIGANLSPLFDSIYSTTKLTQFNTPDSIHIRGHFCIPPPPGSTGTDSPAPSRASKNLSKAFASIRDRVRDDSSNSGRNIQPDLFLRSVVLNDVMVEMPIPEGDGITPSFVKQNRKPFMLKSNSITALTMSVLSRLFRHIFVNLNTAITPSFMIVFVHQFFVQLTRFLLQPTSFGTLRRLESNSIAVPATIRELSDNIRATPLKGLRLTQEGWKEVRKDVVVLGSELRNLLYQTGSSERDFEVLIAPLIHRLTTTLHRLSSQPSQTIKNTLTGPSLDRLNQLLRGGGADMSDSANKVGLFSKSNEFSRPLKEEFLPIVLTLVETSSSIRGVEVKGSREVRKQKREMMQRVLETHRERLSNETELKGLKRRIVKGEVGLKLLINKHVSLESVGMGNPSYGKMFVPKKLRKELLTSTFESFEEAQKTAKANRKVEMEDENEDGDVEWASKEQSGSGESWEKQNEAKMTEIQKLSSSFSIPSTNNSGEPERGRTKSEVPQKRQGVFGTGTLSAFLSNSPNTIANPISKGILDFQTAETAKCSEDVFADSDSSDESSDNEKGADSGDSDSMLANDMDSMEDDLLWHLASDSGVFVHPLNQTCRHVFGKPRGFQQPLYLSESELRSAEYRESKETLLEETKIGYLFHTRD
ncbi:hypothetical protein BLNAU_22678 [Blattamonas nauphoetae]|uniref:Uncharacterized protein n=1 Tax=Blattamonas nauphoetae TaxID=2049346 RepID=A0ABQ9WSD0_9EUKA|nr:hypothetical protein BLNAU_22678 [Blattamonas nauphoetae]